MKKILQIAGGIILGVLILWLIRIAFVGIMVNQMNEQVQESFTKLGDDIIQRQEMARQKQVQAQQQAGLEKQRRIEQQKLANQKRLEAIELESRKRNAFNQWRDEPYWCKHPEDFKTLVKCNSLKKTQRQEFEKLLATGQLTLN